MSTQIEGHTLQRMTIKELITFEGFDKKGRLNIYKIPCHTAKMIQDIIQ